MAKIHRATVTEADLNYVGSITVDEALIEACGMKPFQYVNITNLRNGIFWQTYIIPGPRGNGDICLNGPPAHHFQKGDIVIILAEAWIEERELKDLDPVVVFVDGKNNITDIRKHKAIPVITTWTEKSQVHEVQKKKTGLTVHYTPAEDEGALIDVSLDDTPILEAAFRHERIDEAHILYTEAIEILDSLIKAGKSIDEVRKELGTLFAIFRGEKINFPIRQVAPSGEFRPNIGKKLEIDVDGEEYLRLPVRTKIITEKDDMLELIKEYVEPYVQKGDSVYVSEKALTITQNRVIDMSEIRPGPFAHFLARRVGNYFGSKKFRGFGHGTALAMQLFIDEAGFYRVLFAAAVSAVTRPLGIRGLFYRICGKQAKSIDCPMSFTILRYTHSAKLPPQDPNGAAEKIKYALGGKNEVVILDANYRGAFSLGKSDPSIKESFIGKAFRDNPLGQSDELTPFCILRKKSALI